MIDPVAVRENLDDWLKNPSWAEYYNDAPSQKCREYISAMFYASETEEEEAFEAMDKLEETLTKEDLTYLYNNSTGPEKARLYKLIQQA